MKCSMASCILLALLAAYASGKRSKGKPSMDDQLSKKGNFDCLSCLTKNAPQCIPLCFPNPFTKPCISCIITAAVECLKDCGLPKTAALVDHNSCTARPDAQGDCGVYKDNCEPGSVAVPSKISFPPLPYFCVCSCEPERADDGEMPVKMQ